MGFTEQEATQLRQQYRDEGYVIFRNAIDRKLATEASAHVDWLRAQHPDTRPEQLHAHLMKDDPFWYRLVSDSRIVDIAEVFIGGDVASFASHYICKPPKTGQAVLWHQDGAFWPLDPMNVITLWLAVSDSKTDNGCLHIIPRTHKKELKGLRERQDIDSVLGAEMDEDIDESDAIAIELEPGDVSVHHPNVIHGSEANESDRWRKGLTIRYIPTSTRITEPEAGAPFLLRGKAVPGVNHYLEVPRFDPNRHFSFRDAKEFVKA